MLKNKNVLLFVSAILSSAYVICFAIALIYVLITKDESISALSVLTSREGIVLIALGLISVIFNWRAFIETDIQFAIAASVLYFVSGILTIDFLSLFIPVIILGLCGSAISLLVNAGKGIID